MNIMQLFIPAYKRYAFNRILLVVLCVAFGAFLLAYFSKFIVGKPFNWDTYLEYLFNQVTGTIATTIYFYYALNLFHYLFQQKKRFSAFILPSVLCIVAVEAYNLGIDYLHPLQSNIDDPMPLPVQLLGNLLLALTYLGAALLIAYVNNLRDERKKHQLLKEQKLQLEVEKMQADLKFLKSQINPHFLHNTLNSFYSRSLPVSKELADGILTLSEIMRYALGETNSVDGKVMLKDEIEHVRNVIKINQFRFRNNLRIDLDVRGVINGAAILPFVLITLVENIFKHGDLTDAEHPIKILVQVQNGSLRYYSRNKKKSGPRELSTGIGLDNIKKRLDLVYGENFTLEVRDEADFYTTELVINKL